MNLVAAVRFPFQDPRWISKTLTATLLLFIPVIGWLALMGYGLRVVRRVTSGNTSQMPEWKDFGRDFNTGIPVLFGSLIYAAPLLIFACMGLVVDSLGGSEALTILVCCITVPLFVYIVLVTPLVYSAIAQYTFTHDFADFFNFAERIRDTNAHLDKAMHLILASILIWLGFALPLTIAGILIALLFTSPLIAFCGLLLLGLPITYLFAILTIAGYHLVGQWALVIGAHRFVRRRA